VIHHNPGLRSSHVAEALGIKRTNFVPLLDELERRGLVGRHRDPRDGRAFTLRLTPEGEALLRRATRRVQAHERRVAERLEPGGAAHLLRLLGQVAVDGS
jgi:DNA-binding MarR family transcriptional regulator